MLFWDPRGGWINSVPGGPFPLGRRQSSYCTSICPPAEASGQRCCRAWEDPQPSHQVCLENQFFLWVQPKGPTITPIHRESLSTKNEIATPSSTPHPGLHISKCTGSVRSPLPPHLVLRNHTRHSHSLQVRHLLDIKRFTKGKMRSEMVISESYLHIEWQTDTDRQI